MSDAAPGSLCYVEQLVNTHNVEYEIDEVPTPEALAAWLRARRLLPDAAPVTRADYQKTLLVREGLRALIAANNAPPGITADPQAGTDGDALGALAVLAPDLPLVVDVATGTPSLVPRQRAGGVDAALATLLAAATEAVAAGTWHRLKACRNPRCRWAYYDQSRNRSRAWCSMDTCGNRAKARAFRERG